MTSKLEDLDKAQALGLDLKGVTEALIADGVDQFSKAADTLLAAVEDKRRAFVQDSAN